MKQDMDFNSNLINRDVVHYQHPRDSEQIFIDPTEIRVDRLAHSGQQDVQAMAHACKNMFRHKNVYHIKQDGKGSLSQTRNFKIPDSLSIYAGEGSMDEARKVRSSKVSRESITSEEGLNNLDLYPLEKNKSLNHMNSSARNQSDLSKYGDHSDLSKYGELEAKAPNQIYEPPVLNTSGSRMKNNNTDEKMQSEDLVRKRVECRKIFDPG